MDEPIKISIARNVLAMGVHERADYYRGLINGFTGMLCPENIRDYFQPQTTMYQQGFNDGCDAYRSWSDVNNKTHGIITAYDHGFNTFLEGGTMEDCPFDKSIYPWKYSDWLDGFSEANMEHTLLCIEIGDVDMSIPN